MRRTRVVLAEMRGVHEAVVRRALAHADIEIVGDALASEDAPAEIRNRRADVLIVGRELSELVGRDIGLLCGCLGTPVFVVTRGGHAFRYEIRARRVALTSDADGVSGRAIVDAVREATGQQAPDH